MSGESICLATESRAWSTGMPPFIKVASCRVIRLNFEEDIFVNKEKLNLFFDSLIFIGIKCLFFNSSWASFKFSAIRIPFSDIPLWSKAL